MSVTWYLSDIGYAHGLQDLFSRQSPQKLKVLREHAMAQSAISSIRVDAATAKKRRDRDVEMQPNLIAWLAPYRQHDGLLYFSRWTLRKVRKEAKVDWPPNGMRHSFGTYHLAQFQNAGKTALQLGHVGEPEVLHQHYKARVTAEEAAAFWNIRPESVQSKIVTIARAG